MVALAQALMVTPKFLVVDELSFGLAPMIVARLVPVIERELRGAQGGHLGGVERRQLVPRVGDHPRRSPLFLDQPSPPRLSLRDVAQASLDCR